MTAPDSPIPPPLAPGDDPPVPLGLPALLAAAASAADDIDGGGSARLPLSLTDPVFAQSDAPVHAAQVTCRVCQETPFAGGDVTDDGQVVLPPVIGGDGELADFDGQAVLTDWAAGHCRRDDCPNTPDAVAAAHAASPEGMAEQIADLQAQLARLLDDR